MNAARALREGIASIPELEVLGDPPATIVTFGARDKKVGIYVVGDRLEAAGWTVDRQQKPECRLRPAYSIGAVHRSSLLPIPMGHTGRRRERMVCARIRIGLS